MASGESTASQRVPPTAWLGDLWVGGWLLAALVWTAGQLGGYLPQTLPGTWLMLALATAGEVGRRLVEPRPPRLWGVTWLPLPFLIYAAANVAWVSPVPWWGRNDWWGWALGAVTFALVLNGLRLPVTRRCLALAVLGVTLVGVGAQLHQRWWSPEWLPMGRLQADQFLGRTSGFFGIPNSQAAWLLLVLPPLVGGLAAGRRGRGVGGALGLLGAGLLVLGVGLTISRGAWLATLGLLVLWPLLGSESTWRRRLAWSGLALAAGLLLGGALYAWAPGVKPRFDAMVREGGEHTRPIMWRGAWQLWRDAPVWGTGAGSYNVLFERHRPENYRDEPRWAHQDYLNTLSDYGLVGVGLVFPVAAGALAWALRRAGRRRRDPLVRGLLFALGVFALTLGIDFHLKIPALMMLVALVAAETWRRLAGAEPEARGNPAWRRALTGAVGVFVLGAMVMDARPHFRAEGPRDVARRAINGLAGGEDPAREEQVLSEAVEVLRAVTARRPGHGQAWADRAYAEGQLVNYRPDEWQSLAQSAEVSARRALALGGGEEVMEFWLRLGVALNLQGRWVEAGRCFSRALELAPASSVAWYHQAYHYSLRPATRGLARGAIATSLRLDPGHPAAEALRRQLVASPAATPPPP
jgi:O-antigen ligase